ncbi:MAG TPA: thiol peroxidase [Thiotrichaceae bacterium]|jgi:thiol peroxidase|nr:thiol peroxidase [Thiotrichaceae bacterium]HIM09055.1 thiol peroxidase [Gammaproteobacteria bacterium]
MAKISLQGKEVNTNGDLPKVGDDAPDFTLVNAKLNNVTLGSYEGKKKLLSIVPSLDTDVCSVSTKKFNDAAKEKSDAVFLMISSDLPFAMSRFCKAEGTDNVKTLSMMRSRTFAKDYGVLIEDGPLAGITCRAVLVIDENNKVIYSELVSEITQEPNYDAALAVL